MKVCVKECPKVGKKSECILNDLVTKCPSGVDADILAGATNVTYDTRDMMGYCVPKYQDMKDKAAAFYAEMDKSTGGSMSRYVIDLSEAWIVLMCAGLIAFFISSGYLYLLYWIAKPLIYGSMFGVLLFGILFTAFSGMQFNEAPSGSED